MFARLILLALLAAPTDSVVLDHVDPQVQRSISLARRASAADVYFRAWGVVSDRGASTGPLADRIRYTKQRASSHLRVDDAFEFAALGMLIPDLADEDHQLEQGVLHLVIELEYADRSRELFIATSERIWDGEGIRSAPLPDALKRKFGFEPLGD